MRELASRRHPVAGSEKRPRGLRPGAHRQRLGDQIGVARECECPDAAGVGSVPAIRQVGEAAQCGRRVGGRLRDGGREHAPGALGLAPAQKQLGRKAVHERLGVGRQDRAQDPLPLLRRRFGERTRGARELRRCLAQRGRPFARRPFPLAHALQQFAQLDAEHPGPPQRASPEQEHLTRLLEAVRVLQRDRPLAVRRLVPRLLGRPALRQGTGAVRLVQRDVGAEQQGPQRGVPWARRHGALGRREQLG